MHTTISRFNSRLMAAAAAALAIGAGGTAAAAAPAPEAVSSFAFTADAVAFGSADGPEGVYQAGPMAGKVEFGIPEDGEHTVTFLLETGDEPGDLGQIRIEATGTFDIDPAAGLPPRWDLTIDADLTVTFSDPPPHWLQDGDAATGPLVLHTAEPLRFTGALDSLTPESFTVDGGSTQLVRTDATATAAATETAGGLPMVGGMMAGNGGGGGLPLPI